MDEYSGNPTDFPSSINADGWGASGGLDDPEFLAAQGALDESYGGAATDEAVLAAIDDQSWGW